MLKFFFVIIPLIFKEVKSGISPNLYFSTILQFILSV